MQDRICFTELGEYHSHIAYMFRHSSGESSGGRRPREPRPVSPPPVTKRQRTERHRSTPEAEIDLRHGYHQRRTPTPPQPLPGNRENEPRRRQSPLPTSHKVGIENIDFTSSIVYFFVF